MSWSITIKVFIQSLKKSIANKIVRDHGWKNIQIEVDASSIIFGIDSGNSRARAIMKRQEVLNLFVTLVPYSGCTERLIMQLMHCVGGGFPWMIILTKLTLLSCLHFLNLFWLKVLFFLGCGLVGSPLIVAHPAKKKKICSSTFYFI